MKLEIEALKMNQETPATDSLLVQLYRTLTDEQGTRAEKVTPLLSQLRTSIFIPA